MGDFAVQSQDFNRVTISTAHPESIGAETLTAGQTFGTAAAWPAANRAIFVPFVVRSPIIVVKLFIHMNAASGNVDVGVYDTGGNRLSSAGSTAASGSGVQAFDVTDFTLAAGAYYFGAALDNTVATLVSLPLPVGAASGFGVLSQSSAFPLPNPATFAAAQDAYVPLIGLTARTVV